MGYQAKTTGVSNLGAISLGYNTSAAGQGAVALGFDATASTNVAVALGYGVTEDKVGAVALGQYNTNVTGAVLEVGYGADDANRANVFEVFQDGTATLPGASIAEIDTRGNTAVVTKEYLDDALGLFSSTPVYNETPTVTDGSPDVTLAHTPTTDTQRVYLNGVRQVPGSGNDYTISGNTITFEFNLASNDTVVVDYLYS
jgi:hypothetical protein